MSRCREGGNQSGAKLVCRSLVVQTCVYSGSHQASGACVVPILLILLTATVIELAVLIAVGHAIGILATIGLLILSSLIGAILLRREGSRTLTAFMAAVRTRRPPHSELIDGILIAAAGVLIVLPGFVSDGLGLLLLLPPIRALVRRQMLRSASRHAPRQFAPGAVVDGEVVEDPPHHPSRGELR
ncbi:MAG: FxsA family protein [Pseudonocardiales bacterium]|nr:FxsA family protein [Pseudonocardiales bacterium]